MALSATLSRVEALNNPVTLAKFRKLIDDTTISVAGTAETQNIANGAVTVAKLADNAVSTAKIQDAAVTSAKIVADAVTTAKILDAAVTSAKIAAGAITEAKIDPTLLDAIQALAHGGMFLGEVRQFIDTALPDGFVLCDGGSYSHADYPRVQTARTAGTDPFMKFTETSTYAAGRFQAPDLRGQFIRVWQTGKSLTAAVAASFASHNHTLLGGSDDSAGHNAYAMSQTAKAVGGTQYGNTSLVNANSAGTALIGSTGGAETAPMHRFLVFAVYIGLHA